MYTNAIPLRPKAALVLSPIDEDSSDETKTTAKKSLARNSN